MKLIIVRHGETEANKKDIMQGQTSSSLTKKGKEQIKKLSARLKNEKIDVIFSSDLPRARLTTEEIAKYHKIPLHYLAELRERDVGVLEGVSKEEFFKARDDSGLSKLEFKPENGESFTEMIQRVQGFLEMLLRKYTNKTVLICSHGGFIKMTLGILLKKPPEEAIKMDQHNACINIIEVDGNRNAKTIVLNSTDHL